MEQEQLRHLSQNLRKCMTKEERHLWYDFLKTYPIQFKRQYTVGNYIVDFYCYRAKLVVELDGSQHCDPKQMEYDHQRTLFLQKQDLFVLRFSNRDVLERFRSVCEAIDLTVRNRVRD
jgi:very-short-patch-repair endonuclease